MSGVAPKQVGKPNGRDPLGTRFTAAQSGKAESPTKNRIETSGIR